MYGAFTSRTCLHAFTLESRDQVRRNGALSSSNCLHAFTHETPIQTLRKSSVNVMRIWSSVIAKGRQNVYIAVQMACAYCRQLGYRVRSCSSSMRSMRRPRFRARKYSCCSLYRINQNDNGAFMVWWGSKHSAGRHLRRDQQNGKLNFKSSALATTTIGYISSTTMGACRPVEPAPSNFLRYIALCIFYCSYDY